MASEIEVKFELSPDAADRVAELTWLHDITCGPAKQVKLVSVYFDTGKQRLRAHGLSLRVRHVGDKRLQTIKAENKGTRGGGFGRDEWEREIAGNRPDLKLAEGTALEKLATRKLKRKLRPLFETVIERTAIPLRCDGTVLELALDRGQIRGNGRRRCCGVAASTLTRIAQHKRPDVDGLAALLKWSGLTAESFFVHDNHDEGEPEPLAQMTALLRADPTLSEAGNVALETMIKTTYTGLKEGKL